MAKSKQAGKASKTEAPSLEEWVRFDPDVYENAIEGLVHFSAKAVNSNAVAGGVRVSKVVELPYLSVSTLGTSSVGLDYTKNAGQTARITKQINSVLSGTADARFGVPSAEVEKQIIDEISRINAQADIAETKKTEMSKTARKTIIGKSPLDSVPDSEKQVIRNAMARLEGKSLIEGVDCHIKQVVMPDMNGSDVTLSPLHSAGMSGAINEVESAMLAAINAEITDGKNKKKRLAHIHRIEMNFGGANPQNVGGQVREMRHPLFVLPPHEDRNAKAVFSIHFKGVPVVTTRSIDEFLAVTDKHRGNKENMLTRIEIEHALRKVVRISLQRGRDAFDTLDSNTELLPVDLDEKPILLDEEVINQKPLVAGLILLSKRNAAWRSEFSEYVAFAIMNRVRKLCAANGEWNDVGSGISGTEAQSMRSLIESEVLQ